MAYEMVRLLNSDHPYRYDGTLFGGTKLWTPRELTTALWLDADSPSSITLNGATVSQWNDLSGNGRHATQATAANQPTYTASAINSKPALTFDGGDFMSGLWAGATASEATIVAVGTYGSSAATQAIASVGTPATNSGFGIGWNTSGVIFTAFLWSVNEATYSGFVATPLIQVGVLSPSSITQSFNGYTSAVAIGVVPGVGTSYQVGGINGTLLLSNGSRVSEVVILSSAASTDNRQKLEGYLAWKWGTEASLPVSHPYYSAPPLV